ncbi:hypothetical protein M758_1G303000 [Ceratodon purpureus]|nr:hypothetical protein M758_1G303000 [Ceratodon purpureus]
MAMQWRRRRRREVEVGVWEWEGGWGWGWGGMDAEAAGRQMQRRRRRRRRRTRKTSEVVLDSRTRIKRRVKYLLMKMRVDQNLLDAYSGEGWNGQSREKIRPERELQRAEAQILHSKLAIREAMHELDDLGLEGSLDENAFDAEGRVFHEEIFCAKCKSQDALPDNDIILCDGACNRGFHQYCLEPPLATINIPPGDEGWLCPVCECKMECVEVINAYLGTNFEVENSWEMLFAKEALIAAGGGAQDGADGDFPSSDSEDDDYDPEGGEKLANSESEGESDNDGEDSDSGSGLRENEASASDNDEERSIAANLKRLSRGGGSSDSDDSEVSLVDELQDGDAKLGVGRRDSQAEESASDEDAMVIGGKRHRKAVDYRRLHDEMFGNTEIDDDNIPSEDEDWGPERRRRRTIPDDPSRPRVRRRRARSDLPPGSQGEGAADTPEREKRMWRRLPDSAVEVLRRDVVVNTLPSKTRKEELATELGLSFSQVHGWFKNQRHQALRKGLVSSRRPHLVASSSKAVNAVNAVNGVKTPASEQVDATETMMFQDESNSNAYLTEKLDEVQLRLLELKQTLEDFARNTRVVDDDDRNVGADNNFGNGGIGLPANGRRIIYVPVAEVRERAPVSAHTSAC